MHNLLFTCEPLSVCVCFWTKFIQPSKWRDLRGTKPNYNKTPQSVSCGHNSLVGLNLGFTSELLWGFLGGNITILQQSFHGIVSQISLLSQSRLRLFHTPSKRTPIQRGVLIWKLFGLWNRLSPPGITDVSSYWSVNWSHPCKATGIFHTGLPNYHFGNIYSVMFKRIISQQNFAHEPTALLLIHGQNLCGDEQRDTQIITYNSLELGRKIACETKT